MAETVFQCPKCSQLNTTRRFTCKNCGTNFEMALAGIEPMEKSTRGSAFALIFKVFIVIVILGILAAVVLPKFVSCGGSGAPIASARGIGAAISATIQAKHSDYLNSGNDYTLDNVLTDTILACGIKYQATASNTPANGEITSNVAGIAIILNYGKSNYVWDYTPRNGNTPALLTENMDSDF